MNGLSRDSLPSQIKERLLQRITDGTLQPGDRLVELKIAAEMETSQAPVREAIRQLEAMGVVETQRNKGARVRTVSSEELKDIYDVRGQLEGYAAALATRRQAQIRAALNRSIDDMRAAAADDDFVAFGEANSAFHQSIVAATGNRVLLDLWETLNVKFRTIVNVLRQQQDLTRIAESHVTIVAAIDSGDPAAARKAAEDHVLANRPA
jgi:DNA-binding GntR family transcriptional regulator